MTYADFAITYLGWPPAKRANFLDGMCRHPYYRACLEMVVKQMANAWTVGREVEAIAGNSLITALMARGHISE